MNSTLRCLNHAIVAYKRIERGWCKGNLGIDRDGNTIIPNDLNEEMISQHCAIGAICYGKTYLGDTFLKILNILDDEISNLGFKLDINHPYFRSQVVAYNNHPDTTHEDILNLFKSCINRLEKELFTKCSFIDSWEVEIQAQIFDLVRGNSEAVCV